MAAQGILEGVFGIHKPPGISSAQVLRDLETQFNTSNLFRPLLAAGRAAAEQERKLQGGGYRRTKGRDTSRRVKLGHGGTLDPLATGVLITGVGKGTKTLGDFLGCTKTYEAVVLFGCATDTYDSTGKIVRRAPYQHVTREIVEQALQKFRGSGMQIPPIYSALKVNGKKMYQYAREGGEIPVLKERPVEVYELEVLDWMEPGSHNWKYPTEEAPKEEKAAANRLMDASMSKLAKDTQDRESLKRKHEEDDIKSTVTEDPTAKKAKTTPEPVMSGALPAADSAAQQDNAPEESANTSKQSDVPAAASSDQSPPNPKSDDGTSAPAALIRMKVSSGFYVRTLCHELGAAVNSLGAMTYLVRTCQGDFELGRNVLEYEDLAKGEGVWGPKVKGFLEEWMAKHP